MIVAVLHDVLEDSEWTFEGLVKEGFSQNVMYALSLLTHDKNTTHDDYIRAISTDSIAKAVSLEILNTTRRLQD